jgi:ribosome-binding factor A
MRPFKRYQRLQQEIQRIVAEALEFEARDPRLSEVTVLQVRVSNDLRRAKIYISCLNDPKEALKALDRASGFLRSKIARGIRSKYTPEISFLLETEEAELGP